MTLERQNQIYNKHMNDFAGPAAKQRELEAQEERQKDERRKLIT